jgi:hypothetical protein
MAANKYGQGKARQSECGSNNHVVLKSCIQTEQVKLRKISYIRTNYSDLVYTGFRLIRDLVLTGFTVYTTF